MKTLRTRYFKSKGHEYEYVVSHTYIPDDDKRTHTGFYGCGTKLAAEHLVLVLNQNKGGQ